MKIKLNFLPFNFQKINKYFLLFIIFLAIFLRLYKLGTNPPSLDWDEASLGYNAYSILKTGKDEFGRFLPISIRSFEDYKPAVYTYLTIPAIYLFGLNEFAVRLPSSVLGIFTVLVVYFLVKELTKNKKIAFLTSLFLCISPWHLQFSRVAFESNISLFFVLAGLLFFLKGIKKGSWLILSAILLSISFYCYHSPRLVVPLLLMGWVIYFRKQLWLQKKYVIIAFFIGVILSTPFVLEIFGKGKSRFLSVSVLVSEDNLKDSIKDIEYDRSQGDFLGNFLHNRRITFFYSIVKGYLDHFNINFLFLQGDGPGRHHANDMGMLYLWEAPFIIIGFFQLLKKRNNFLIFWWFIVAPCASSITTGTPHAVRALLYLPIYQLFSAVGLIWFFKYVQYKKYLKPVICFFIILNIIYYLEMYYVHTPIEAASEWQYGYKQAVELISKNENKVDKIIMTYTYDQPHIYVLFYQQIDPLWYQNQYRGEEIMRAKRGFGKFEFRNIDWEKDQNLKNVLFIGTAQEIPAKSQGWIEDIYFPNGKVAFRIVKR